MKIDLKKPISLRKLRSVLKKRFSGILTVGSHQPNGKACALELLSVCREIPWTDEPYAVGSWDLRSLNDMNVSNATRTEHLPPVLAVYSNALSWPKATQKRVRDRLIVLLWNTVTCPSDPKETIKEVLRAARLVPVSSSMYADCKNLFTARQVFSVRYLCYIKGDFATICKCFLQAYKEAYA